MSIWQDLNLLNLDQVIPDQVSSKMEQPTAPQQVIYVIQMPKEKVANLKGSYLVKAATTLGGVHIVCGIAVLIASITGLVFQAFEFSGEYRVRLDYRLKKHCHFYNLSLIISLWLSKKNINCFGSKCI